MSSQDRSEIDKNPQGFYGVPVNFTCQNNADSQWIGVEQFDNKMLVCPWAPKFAGFISMLASDLTDVHQFSANTRCFILFSTLWSTNTSMENHHFHREHTLNIAIFHSYVSSGEGIFCCHHLPNIDFQCAVQWRTSS